MPTQSRTPVAAIQMVSSPDPAENCLHAQRLVAEAAAQGASLVVLPEYWPMMGRLEQDKLAIAEAPDAGPLQQCMADMARRHGIWLVGGTLPLVSHEPGKVRNTTLVYDPSGTRVQRYDKIHLFSFSRGEEAYNEARTITHGEQVATFAAPIGRVGLSICYDLRFPELYRAMGDCALIVVPAAFTYTTGKAHWEILLRARAIENQCYVLAAAQGGVHPNGRRTWGHSMLVDPWGEVQSVRPEGEGVVTGMVDVDRLAQVRQSLPALQHRTM